MGRFGLLVTATLIASGFGAQHVLAQSDNPSTQKSEKVGKQKSTEKKNATKQTNTQTNSGGAAPMSGYRPDQQSNY
jgi:hypothetical protein